MTTTHRFQVNDIVEVRHDRQIVKGWVRSIGRVLTEVELETTGERVWRHEFEVFDIDAHAEGDEIDYIADRMMERTDDARDAAFDDA